MMRNPSRALVLLCLLSMSVLSIRAASAQCERSWQPGFQVPGVSGDVWASTVWDPDGNGPEPELLVIGGRFLQAGGVATHNLAAWDGQAWRDLDSQQVGLDLVNDLVVYNGELVVVGSGGPPRGAGSIYVSDGAQWRTILSTDRDVKAALVYNGELYVGGGFMVNYSRIAKWNGTNWSSVGGGVSSAIYDLAVYDGKLVAGGAFTVAGGVLAYKVAAYDGSLWSAVGSGFEPFDDVVSAVVEFNGDLIVGGELSQAGSQIVHNVARWNGVVWSDLSGGTDTNPWSQVHALQEFHGKLYVGGGFDRAGGISSPGIASWTEAGWEPVSSGVRSSDALQAVQTMAPYQGTLYVAGWFDKAGGVGCKSIAGWDGAAWSATSDGPNGEILAVVADGVDAYVGGRFTTIGGAAAELVARYDGTEFHPLGAGLTGQFEPRVYAMVRYGDRLIVGGDYDNAGTLRLNGLAAWDGSNWSGVGGAFPFFTKVFGMTVHAGELIVTGDFVDTPGGGAPVNYIAAWDGQAWHSLGSGLNYFGASLASYGGYLYAAGNFTSAGGVAVNGFARWDGISWEAVPGSPSFVTHSVSLGHYNGMLAMTGNFQDAGGMIANGIVLFDGVDWHGLGGGLGTNGWGYSVAELDGDLFVVGTFSGPGTNVARWDGFSWHALGSGLSDTGLATAVFENDLFVGGRFVNAGGEPAGYLARWGCPRDPAEVGTDGVPVTRGFDLRADPAVFSGLTTLSFRLDQAGPIDVSIFNVEGRRVTTLVDGTAVAGAHAVEWKAPGSSGAYWAVLQVGRQRAVARMTVLR
ncbi:MAG: hypothetical protein R3E12_04380 [Candidatus Eisenbacteria bacterium]